MSTCSAPLQLFCGRRKDSGVKRSGGSLGLWRGGLQEVGSCIPMSPGSLQPRGGAPGLDGGGLEQQRVWCSPCAAMVCQAPAGCRLSVLSPGRHQGAAAPAPNCFPFWYYEQNTRYVLRLGKTFIFLCFPVALLCCLVRLDACPTCSEFVTSVDCLSCCRTCGRRREEAGKGYFFEKSF